jgi:hypothetical protein
MMRVQENSTIKADLAQKTVPFKTRVPYITPFIGVIKFSPFP